MNGMTDDYVMQILMEIKEDVSAIKTKLNGIETDKVDTDNELSTLREMIQRNTDAIANLQNEQNVRDAKRWRSVTAYVLTALGGFVISQLPEIIRTLYVAVIGGY